MVPHLFAALSNRAAIADADLARHRAHLRFLREQHADDDDTCPVCQAGALNTLW